MFGPFGDEVGCPTMKCSSICSCVGSICSDLYAGCVGETIRNMDDNASIDRSNTCNVSISGGHLGRVHAHVGSVSRVYQSLCNSPRLQASQSMSRQAILPRHFSSRSITSIFDRVAIGRPLAPVGTRRHWTACRPGSKRQQHLWFRVHFWHWQQARLCQQWNWGRAYSKSSV